MSHRTHPGRLVVAAAIVDRLPGACPPSELLCAARAYPSEHAGQYEFPGGKVEPGETPTAALMRELVEELNLTVRLGDEILPTPDLAVEPPMPTAPADTFETAHFPEDDQPAWPAMHGHRMRVWLAQPADTPPRLGAAHAAVHWVALDQVGTLPWLPADLPILEVLRHTITDPTG
ncbi:NUDIX domain-containing protein [Actinomyces qiguomingii]|uniref:NUDIX domain-containing protein n=1 Tax=Actinomyces qiguomingii TaxID=2057800 RepID=UPI000CA02982|nr:NUDIX domain-containing protein [Actinomyces qiguomingii]